MTLFMSMVNNSYPLETKPQNYDPNFSNVVSSMPRTLKQNSLEIVTYVDGRYHIGN